MDRYTRVVSEFFSTPWALQKEKLAVMQSLICRRVAGIRLSEEEIEARIGAYKESHAERAQSNAAKKPGAIAVLPVYGVISGRMSQFDDISGGTSCESLTRQFRAFMANADVKAIVLDIDSPGGSVYGVEELWDEIFAARDQKKVIAQVNPLCASAAYYLASAAKEIVITPSGELGSIGVYCAHEDISKYLDELGVKVTLISAGKYKVEGNEFSPLDEEGQAHMLARVTDYYDMFVDAVAEGRGVKSSAVRSGFGEGRVVGAAEAVKLGMADRVSTFDQTIARISAKTGAQVSVAVATDVQQAPQMQAAQAVIPATAEKTEVTEVVMDPVLATPAATPVDRAAIAAQALQAEKDRANKITLLARTHNMSAQLESWLTSDKTVEQVQSEILAGIGAPKTITAPPAAAGERIHITADESDKLPKGVRIARMTRAFAIAKGKQSDAAKVAREQFKDFRAAADLEAQNFAQAGFLLDENMSSEFIDLLMPRSVVRSLQPALAPLIGGALKMRKQTGGATALYIGESAKIPVSKPKGGWVRWSAKKLVALVPISNDLLRGGTSLRADEWVRNDMIRQVSKREDLAFIRDKGTEFTPMGLRYQVAAGNVFHAQAAPDLTKVTTDLGKLRLALRSADVDFLRCGYIMSPRTENFLMNLRDSLGNYAFRTEMLTGKLQGDPYRVTTQIPENLGGGGNESEIYYADFADVVIADAPGIGIEMSSEASYDDGAGNTISTFQSDETLIRVIEEHDIQLRHQESLAVLDQVIWI